MLTCLFLIVLCQTVIGFYLTRDVFAPWIIGSSLWVAILLLFEIVPNNYYPVNDHFIPSLLLWTTGFFVSSIWSYTRTRDASPVEQRAVPNEQIVRLYYFLSFAIAPVIVGVTVYIAVTEDPENVFRYLRIMNTGMDENIEAPDFGPAMNIVSVAYVSMFFALVYSKSKALIASVLVLNFLLAFITMSKTSFLCILFATLYVLYIKKKVTVKHIAFCLVGFALFSIVLNGLRASSSADGAESEGDNIFAMYLLSSTVAYDHFTEPCSSHEPGARTFRLAYALQSALGADVEVADVILPWVEVPGPTNTYTVMYPFYQDFGLGGVLVFSIVYGLFFGYLYRKASSGGKTATILYAVFVTFLVLAFIGEFIFTNLSQSIQYVIIALLPFLIKRRLVLWGK